MTTALNGSRASRVAIVTGGSRGVGRATVRRLAAGGYAVVVNREAARHLRNGGAIVNLSSSAEDSSLRTHGLHAVTKATTNALALELRERDITVNAVSLPVHRPCVPGRVADVIAYLLSDRGHRLTGQVLRVGDAGLRP